MKQYDNKTRLKFSHLFVAGAFLVVLVNYAIGGFAPYFLVLIPAFPFCLLAVLPISWKVVGDSDTEGVIGAGIAALISVIPAIALFAYDMVTGWKGGADIGLGLLYIFLPLYSIGLMLLGYFLGEITALIAHRNFQRLPEIFRTISLFTGIGFCFYFLFRSHELYHLFSYYAKNDPSFAELYEIKFWQFVFLAGVSLLIPIVVFFVTNTFAKKPCLPKVDLSGNKNPSLNPPI